MKLFAVSAALVLATAACAPGGPPAPAPAPVAISDTTSATSAPAAPASAAPAPAASGAARAASAPAARPDSVVLAESDIARQVRSVFGDSAASVADSAVGEGSDEPAWDIDVRSYETHERVAHFVRMFSGSARDRIQRRLERGSRYDPMIRARFRAGGLPEDMSYLALIESGYDPNAYSRAAAVGMWQFMTSTAKGFGLRVDHWVDERRDPIRSTDAAVRFIRALNEQFGSLYLAAAAYNGGPGRVARGLRRFAGEIGDATGEDRFFALAEEDYLPRETKDYVPQLIAAAIVSKDPARYGFDVRPQPEFAYDSVRVPATTPIAAVARAAGASVADVRALNPHLLRGVTPPGSPWWVRVPVGSAASFDSAFAGLEPAERTAFTRVVSKKGDTMARIAARHDLTAKQLAWYNPKTRPLKSGRLRVGETILVPSQAVAAAALDVPDPSLEIYGSSSKGRVVTHVVRRGENLSTIAKKYGTSVATLRRLNGLKKSVIFPGQSIVVKGGTAKRSTARATGAKSRPVAKRSAAKRSAAKRPASKPASAKSASAKSASAKKAPAKKATSRAAASKGKSTKASEAAKRKPAAAKSPAAKSPAAKRAASRGTEAGR